MRPGGPAISSSLGLYFNGQLVINVGLYYEYIAPPFLPMPYLLKISKHLKSSIEREYE